MKGIMYKKYIGDADFYKRTMKIAVPIMIQNGITNFVSLLDNIMVGQVGTEQMTGVAIVNQLMFVFNLMIFGAVSGAGIFGAQYHGNGDHKGVRDTFRFKLLGCLFMTLLGILFFLFAGGGLIRLYLLGDGNVGEIEASFQCALQYLHIMLIGLIPFVISQSYSSTLRETGETILPMIASIAAVAVNMSLNAVLIFGLLGAPKLGAIGAAIATVIARFAEAGILIIRTHSQKKRFLFIQGVYRNISVPIDLAKGILMKGVPLMINETFWAGGMAFLTQCYSLRGFAVVSAVNITSTVANLFNIGFIAMGNAIGIMIGQRLGAGDSEKAIDESRKLTVFSVVLCVVFGIGLAFVSPFFPKIYNTTEEIQNIATMLILVAACYMPLGSLSNAFYFIIRSGGKVWVTVLFDSFYVCLVNVPIIWALSHLTSLSIVPLYFCGQFIEIGKCIIGYIVIKSKVWLQKLV